MVQIRYCSSVIAVSAACRQAFATDARIKIKEKTSVKRMVDEDRQQTQRPLSSLSDTCIYTDKVQKQNTT